MSSVRLGGNVLNLIQKVNTTYKEYTIFTLFDVLKTISGCSDDDNDGVPLRRKGRATFKFVQEKYTPTLEDMAG